jgi:hypothetical protein
MAAWPRSALARIEASDGKIRRGKHSGSPRMLRGVISCSASAPPRWRCMVTEARGEDISSDARSGRFVQRCKDRHVTDSPIVAASTATAAGTLVLAVATFSSVRSAQGSARATESALSSRPRPVAGPPACACPMRCFLVQVGSPVTRTTDGGTTWKNLSMSRPSDSGSEGRLGALPTPQSAEAGASRTELAVSDVQRPHSHSHEAVDRSRLP